MRLEKGTVLADGITVGEINKKKAITTAVAMYTRHQEEQRKQKLFAYELLLSIPPGAEQSEVRAILEKFGVIPLMSLLRSNAMSLLVLVPEEVEPVEEETE